jgi:hypothetical protein
MPDYLSLFKTVSCAWSFLRSISRKEFLEWERDCRKESQVSPSSLRPIYLTKCSRALCIGCVLPDSLLPSVGANRCLRPIPLPPQPTVGVSQVLLDARLSAHAELQRAMLAEMQAPPQPCSCRHILSLNLLTHARSLSLTISLYVCR